MDESAQDSSNVNPLALLFLIAMCAVTMRAEKPGAVKALLAIAAFLPLGQQVVVFGLHFQFFRIVIIAGFCRLISRGEIQGFRFTTIDKCFVGWALAGMICGFLRDPSGIMGASCLGGAFNSFGTYFLIRLLTDDAMESIEHLRLLAFVGIAIAGAMFWEVLTHHDLFAVFGGVPDIVPLREGRFRCQGPFRHPILAGTFAATLFPLMVGLWLQGGRNRKLATAGILASLFCTGAAASSGAILTALAAMIGFGLWIMRDHMRLFRRGIVAGIIVLAMSMRAPVWYIIAKLSDVLGGTGWHRSYLIDQAIKHFGEWWLIGTSYTASWAPAGEVLSVDPNNMDITNHYIEQGLQGGILQLGFFVAIIVICFKIIGRFMDEHEGSKLDPKLVWAFGVSLAAHCTAFISISYFDQIEVFWFWLLAVIASIPAQSQLADTDDEVIGPAEEFEDGYHEVATE